jgi:hypothetical protein
MLEISEEKKACFFWPVCLFDQEVMDGKHFLESQKT